MWPGRSPPVRPDAGPTRAGPDASGDPSALPGTGMREACVTEKPRVVAVPPYTRARRSGCSGRDVPILHAFAGEAGTWACHPSRAPFARALKGLHPAQPRRPIIGSSRAGPRKAGCGCPIGLPEVRLQALREGPPGRVRPASLRQGTPGPLRAAHRAIAPRAGRPRGGARARPPLSARTGRTGGLPHRGRGSRHLQPLHGLVEGTPRFPPDPPARLRVRPRPGSAQASPERSAAARPATPAAGSRARLRFASADARIRRRPPAGRSEPPCGSVPPARAMERTSCRHPDARDGERAMRPHAACLQDAASASAWARGASPASRSSISITP